ncbi:MULTISPECIES: GNAT family N-acetyltransferase [Vitreoscilla]|uniref:GNAT family N-acetyltransferase n=1 Tax=Vitreoscilla stercoraria TaxID=61 RepID=A0ABY4E8Y9_VITST|nr:MULTISPECIES: GNAT family N-acetyltransferase [Vitreoscilla]AUZ06501.2 acyl-CoA N-acyltransferase [Vitreoscilla sp. C1]UOO92213.1 GNAT family N-acetyltransferase [Vitreoscilla stercoraria]
MSDLHYTHIQNPQQLPSHQQKIQDAWHLHNQLRPQFLTDAEKYVDYIALLLSERQQFLIVQNESGQIIGLALFNMHHNTYQGKILFLEDLVIDENLRGTGVGEQVLKQCEHIAKENGCSHLSLDSGVFRSRAHKFYFTHDYIADCFHFSKALA